MRSPELGHCLVELNSGKVVGWESCLEQLLADSGVTADKATLVEILPSLSSVLAGTAPLPPEISCESEKLGPIAIELRHLAGEDDGYLLLSFRRAGERTDSTWSTDALTGLPDRRALDQVLKSQNQRRPFVPFTVLFVDLDGFKTVNDTHGHATGDQVLKGVSERFSLALRDGDFIARYGGDEFVILLQGVSEQRHIEAVVSRMRTEVSRQIEIGGEHFSVEISVGTTTANEPAISTLGLIELADQAMYEAKQR